MLCASSAASTRPMSAPAPMTRAALASTIFRMVAALAPRTIRTPNSRVRCWTHRQHAKHPNHRQQQREYGKHHHHHSKARARCRIPRHLIHRPDVGQRHFAIDACGCGPHDRRQRLCGAAPRRDDEQGEAECILRDRHVELVGVVDLGRPAPDLTDHADDLTHDRRFGPSLIGRTATRMPSGLRPRRYRRTKASLTRHTCTPSACRDCRIRGRRRSECRGFANRTDSQSGSRPLTDWLWAVPHRRRSGTRSHRTRSRRAAVCWSTRRCGLRGSRTSSSTALKNRRKHLR